MIVGPNGQPLALPKPADQPCNEHVEALFRVCFKKICDGVDAGMALVSAQEALCQLYARVCVARGIRPDVGGRDFLARFPPAYLFHARQVAEEARRRPGIASGDDEKEGG